MSDTTIQIDVRQALLDIGKLKADLSGIRAEMARVQQAGKDIFGTQALEAVKIANEIETIRSEYKKLESAADTLRKALAGTFDPVAAAKYAKALAEVDATMADIEATVTPLGLKLKDTFDAPTADAKTYAKEVDDIQGEYNQLAAAAAKLKAALKGTLDPATAAQYKKAIGEADTSLKSLAARGKSLGADLPKGFKEFNQQASVGKEVVGELFGAFTKVTLIAEGVRLLAGFAGEATKVADSYKQTQIAFDKALQGAANTDDVIASLNRFAAANGLAEESVQNAGRALLSYGTPLSELEKELKQVADISAGVKTEFNGLNTIFGKARVAGVLMAEDINQLVDAGVPIIGEFAEILGVSTDQVKKLGSEGKITFPVLQKAFENLTTGSGQFANVASEVAAVTGSATRASAQWAGILREVGAILVPIRNAALDVFSSLAGGINKLLNPTKALNDSYGDQLKKVVDMDARLPGLLTKYTTLSQKTTLTKTEQTELNTTLSDLQKLVPGAVTEVDKYGNALAFNTDKIKTFSDQQKQLLLGLAENKIAQAKVELEGLAKSTERLQKIAANKPVTVDIVGFGGVTKQTEVVLGGQLEALKKIGDEQQKRLDLTTQIAEQEKVVAAIKAGEAVTAPTPTTPPPTPTTPTAPTQTAADRAKAAKEAADLLIEQAQLRAELLAEGVAKERALEEIRFTELKASLNETFKGRTELQGLLEQAEIGHQERLKKIDADAAAEQLAKEIEAIKAKEEARQAAFEAEIAQAEANASVLIGIEREKAERKIQLDKDSAGLTSSGVSLDKQKALFEQYNKDIAEIEKKAAQERINIRLELEQERQAQEVLQFDAAQSKLLADYVSVRGRTEEEIADAEQQIADNKKIFLLQKQKELIDIELKFGTALGEVRKAQLDAQLVDVEGQIKTLIATAGAAAQNGGAFNIFKLFGADTDAEKDAIKESAAEIVGALESITAARLEEANAAKEAADRRVEAAQQALDAEIELSKTGYAAYVSEKELALQKEKAIQAQALAAQKSAARQQLAVDAAQQVSSIITASARIFAEGAKFFPVGLALSIAGVASLIATMATVRTRARAISSGQFRKGGEGHVDSRGVIVGPSHEQGGVIVPEYEGGEFFTSDGERFAVVNRRMTQKHFDLLQAINKDDSMGMERALRSLTKAPRMRSDTAAAIPGAAGGSSSTGQSKPNGISERQFREMLSLLQEWKHSAARPSTRVETRADGTRITTSGNAVKTMRTHS